MRIHAKSSRFERARSAVNIGSSQSRGALFGRIDLVSLLIGAAGMALLVAGVLVVKPGGVAGILADSYGSWLGIMADAVLLYCIYRLIRREEARRLLDKFGSESNAFARDAVRQLRKKQWLTNGRLDGEDLSHAHLQGANLSQAKLRKVDLSYANLSEAILVEADFRGSNLMGLDLRNAECRWADFRNANLRWANLEGTILDGAQFEGADLSFAKLDHTNRYTVNLKGARQMTGLTREEIDLIQYSRRMIRKPMDEFSRSFYRELFRINPSVKDLFLTNIENQALKFAQFMDLLLKSLNDTEKMLPALKALGRRHLRYGVEEKHYEIVNDALINTLRKSLGTTLSPEIEQAWRKMYRMVTFIMIDAVKEMY
jgi:uncharacterized protein YjbI with pentapeptide repeats